MTAKWSTDPNGPPVNTVMSKINRIVCMRDISNIEKGRRIFEIIDAELVEEKEVYQAACREYYGWAETLKPAPLRCPAYGLKSSMEESTRTWAELPDFIKGTTTVEPKVAAEEEITFEDE